MVAWTRKDYETMATVTHQRRRIRNGPSGQGQGRFNLREARQSSQSPPPATRQEHNTPVCAICGTTRNLYIIGTGHLCADCVEVAADVWINTGAVRYE